MCDLAALFQRLADLPEVLGVRQTLLRDGVTAFGDHEGVVILGDGDDEAALRDLRTGLRDGLLVGGPARAGVNEKASGHVLVGHGPGAVDVHAVVGDEAADGRDAVALRIQVLAKPADGGQHGGASLHLVVVSKLHRFESFLKIGTVFFGARNGIRQSQRNWRC